MAFAIEVLIKRESVPEGSGHEQTRRSSSVHCRKENIWSITSYNGRHRNHSESRMERPEPQTADSRLGLRSLHGLIDTRIPRPVASAGYTFRKCRNHVLNQDLVRFSRYVAWTKPFRYYSWVADCKGRPCLSLAKGRSESIWIIPRLHILNYRTAAGI